MTWLVVRNVEEERFRGQRQGVLGRIYVDGLMKEGKKNEDFCITSTIHPRVSTEEEALNNHIDRMRQKVPAFLIGQPSAGSMGI